MVSKQTLTFAYDVEIDLDSFIPKGTVVNVSDGYQKEHATYIEYDGATYCYANTAFVELAKEDVSI